MYQSLYLTLRTTFKHPSKIELLNMLNLINKNQLNSTISVNYQVFDTDNPPKVNKVYGKVPNMKLLNYLASNNYYDTDIDITTLLKQLK